MLEYINMYNCFAKSRLILISRVSCLVFSQKLNVGPILHDLNLPSFFHLSLSA